MELSNRMEISQALKDKLARVSTATACMNLWKMGIRNTYMKGLYPLFSLGTGKRLVGRAVTIRYLPMREDIEALITPEERRSTVPYRRAVESIQPGDALVVDAMGSLEAGVFGDMLATRSKYLGAVFAVVDGAARDTPFIREVGMPTFVRGVQPAGLERALMSSDFNTPVQCGGVLVMPGDVLLADDEGVVVIPPEYIERLVEIGVEEEEEELFIRNKLQEGLSIQDAYPMNEKLLAEYKAQKRA